MISKPITIFTPRPLLKTGTLNLSLLQEMPHITYLSNIHKGQSSNCTALHCTALPLTFSHTLSTMYLLRCVYFKTDLPPAPRAGFL
jgi:hypothetical protein